jgi:hypothetical protein
MRKIRDVLRLSAAGMSKRKIAASLAVSATAARDCIWRARRAGLTWPLPEDWTDAGTPALPTAHGDGEGSSTPTRLGGCSSRVAAAWGDAAAVMGGISRRAPRRLWL